MITPAIRYISSFQDATNSSSIPVPTPLMVDGRIWDKKNLNVSSYRSGRVIPQVKTGWSTLTTGAWRYYNDNPASATVYGRLYNWYALMGIYDAASLADPSLRDNIAPVDWEVATYGEWITLRNILGKSTAAIALKESGPAHWGPTNTATNSSYFTALPGGYKLTNNTDFNRLGSVGYWWPKDATGFFRLDNVSNALGYYSSSTKRYGFSIRLIKPAGIIPNFETTYPDPITANSALNTGGTIPTSYSGTIIERGIVYGTSINPTVANTKIQSGTGTGSYTINITGLSANIEYFIRAYAIDNVVGVIYANNISIITPNSFPTVFTNSISQITTNSALSGGYIEEEDVLTITARGVCWSTSPLPTVASTKTSNGSGYGEFYSDITGLALNTKYYVRAYATNSANNTGYGQQEEFTTLVVPFLNLIFNQYTAYHAYSLRKLSDTYDYRCIRVRRTNSTPNTLTTTVDVFFNSYSEIGLYSDIRYVSGEVTSATTLGEFAASIVNGYENVDGVNINQNIFVVTWYDQSGNGKNTTNSNTGQQPRIVELGNLAMSGGKPAVRFYSANSNFLSLNDTAVPYNSVSSYVVGNAISNTTNNGMLTLGYGGTSNLFWLPSATNIGYISGTAFTNNGIVVGQNRLYELIGGLTTTSAYTNGIQLKPSTVPSSLLSNTFIRLGTRDSLPAIYLDGYISEAISFIDVPDRLNIDTNMMDYYGIQRTPAVTTADVNYIDPTGTAIGGGNATDDFGLSVTAKGMCWNTLENPALGFGASTNNGTGVGSFTSSLNFLSAYTTYYARAYATSAAGTNYGEQKQFTTLNAPASFILDLFPSAHHAYSLRKLRTAYTGFCLRIRRTTASPNPVTTTTVDLAFDANGTISFSSPISNQTGTFTNAVNLGQFAQGTVDGLTAHSVINVVTWYDQSGNNKNPTIATPGQQPRLVNVIGGIATLETSGGKAAVRFTRSLTTRLTIADTTANISNMSSYFVGAHVLTAGTQNAYALSATNRFYIPVSNGVSDYAGYNITPFAIELNNIGSDRRLFELLAPAPDSLSTVEAWSNGVSGGTFPLSSGTISNIWLGHATNSNYYDGYIQEVIGWQSNTYRGEKEMNINAYWTIY